MIELLRCAGAIAVHCRPEDQYIKVGILVVQGQGGEARLINTEDGAAYPVELPPAGTYYRVLLERLPDAPTL